MALLTEPRWPKQGRPGRRHESDLVQTVPVSAGGHPHAVWPYLLHAETREVEELLAQRGIVISREAVCCWVMKFGPLIAGQMRRRRTAPTGRWHPD